MNVSTTEAFPVSKVSAVMTFHIKKKGKNILSKTAQHVIEKGYLCSHGALQLPQKQASSAKLQRH